MPEKRSETGPTPEARLRAIIATREPEVQRLLRGVRAVLRRRFPTANELAYDYGRSVVVTYSPTENGIEGILTLSAKAEGVFLYFSQGPKLPDPKGLLRGKAKMVRFVQLDRAGDLATPDVAGFIAAALKQSKIPFPARGKGRLIIKSDGKKKAAGRTRSAR